MNKMLGVLLFIMCRLTCTSWKFNFRTNHMVTVAVTEELLFNTNTEYIQRPLEFYTSVLKLTSDLL